MKRHEAMATEEATVYWENVVLGVAEDTEQNFNIETIPLSIPVCKITVSYQHYIEQQLTDNTVGVQEHSTCLQYRPRCCRHGAGRPVAHPI